MPIIQAKHFHTVAMAFHKQLLDVAAEYKTYGKVDDMARWAPTRCAFSPEPHARLSASKDSGSHGRKMYFLYARERDDYVKNAPPLPGQVVVKEPWYPLAGASVAPAPTPAKAVAPFPFPGLVPIPITAASPALSGKPAGLFIMMKLDAHTADTDNGWVYGTVSADGKTVASSGRVQSCMGCHASVTNDRLFGLAKDYWTITLGTTGGA